MDYIEQILDMLQEDLRNEFTHMHFYLSSASLVLGPHRLHMRPWLLGEATSEMNHVDEFSKMIVSFGGEPTSEHHSIPKLRFPSEIIDFSIELEQHVVDRYTSHIEYLEDLMGRKDLNLARSKVYQLILFYEKQIEHSHGDLDELRTMRVIKDI